MKGHVRLVLVCIGLLVPAVATAERRDHGAHVHGMAEMDIAALAGELEIALRSPAVNIVGFEHEPRTEEQRQRMQDALEALRDGAALFAFGETACTLRDAEVSHDHDAPGHPDGDDEHEGHDQASGHGHDEHADGDDHADHGHDEGHADGDDHDDVSHSGIRARYHFACEGAVVHLEMRLFERFPGTESVRVQYLTDDSQGAKTLTPAAPVLRLQ